LYHIFITELYIYIFAYGSTHIANRDFEIAVCEKTF